MPQGSVLPEPLGHGNGRGSVPKALACQGFGSAIAHSFGKAFLPGLCAIARVCAARAVQSTAAAHCVTFGQSAAARKARIHVYDEFKADVQRQGFDQGFRQGHADGDSLLLQA